MSAIPTAARLAVRSREFGRCARCSTGDAHDIHHRMRRREGHHAWSNLILLCRACHEWAHKNPGDAREFGYIVPTWEIPQDVPVKTWRGMLLLDDEGRIAFVRTKEKEEA